ncbi:MULTISPECIES: DnaJ C-terminal domain-containing protein [Inquilinus]|uniref:DnaJ-class molecular chaperone n=1 Tax=Inquilinus ginsengisoli TaxID=363840 RepID=A0ABU1JT71_9PROT|nr:DnaJ C-terminal domain-containing protein [Inquilinus ginsengisoli]MDR6291819.1 DnaJ-class molecular chaperone [Inquilinus ginsengisoli]
MDDPYTVLGVPRTASDDDIRRAYRKLAKKHHPDLNQGDPRAEERFKSVSTAYDLLGDAAKRKRFDAGEIDATGAERPYARRAGPGPGMGAGMGGGGTRYQRYDNYDAFTDAGDLDDVLRGMFGQGANARAGGGKGRDVTYALRVEFRRAIEGGETTVTLADGRSLKVTLPVGLTDGQTIRLRGQGEKGPRGVAGDALIEVRIIPDPVLERDGNDIRMILPVSLPEAVLGGRVEVPTLLGPVVVTIPKGSNSGTVLRLKGKGVRNPTGDSRGDQYVRLAVTLPDPMDPDLARFLEEWAVAHPYDPRAGKAR